MDKNGVSLIGNEDMDGIKVWVANNTPIPVSIEGGGASGGSSLPSKKPKIMPGIDGGSFSTLTTLEDIIPNGFMLLHNDLVALAKKLESKSGIGGLLSTAGAAGFGSALGAGAAGFVEGFSSGLSDDSASHLEGIADDLNMKLTAADFEGDPDIEAVQKEAFKTYLKTYYSEQTAAMAGQAVGSFVSEAVVSSMTGIVDGMLESLGLKEKEIKDKLLSLADVIDEDFTIDDLTSDEVLMKEILDTQKSMFATYLKVYYAAQIADMGGETVGNAVGGFLQGTAEGLIKGTIGALVNIFTGRKEEAESLAEIAEQLTLDMNTAELARDKEIRDEQRKSVIQYLKLYYQAQINEMSAETMGSDISDTISAGINGVVGGVLGGIGGVIGGVIGGIFSWFSGDGKKKTQSNSLALIVEDIEAATKASDFTDDADVKLAQKTAIVNYLTVYYASQVSQMTIDGFSNTVGAGIEGFVDSVKGIISGVFGLRDQEAEKTHLQEVVDDITENIKASDYTSDATVVGLQKSTVLEYLRVYYSAQVDELQASSEKGWFTDLLTNAGEAIGGFLSGLFGKEKQSPFLQAVAKVMEIDVEKYKNMPEVEDEISDHITDAIKLILDEQNEAIVDWFKGDIDGETEKALKNFRTAYNEAFRRSIGSIDMRGLTGDLSDNTMDDIVGKMNVITIRLGGIQRTVNDILEAIPPIIPVSVPVSTTTDEELLEA